MNTVKLVPKIETSRLILTWPTEEQIHQYYNDIKDSTMFKTILWDGPSGVHDLQEYWTSCTKWNPNVFSEDLHVAIIEKSTNKYIGGAALRPVEKYPHHLDVGYALAPKYHGQGYATEAVKALVNEAFLKREAERIFANVFENNQSSKNVVEKIGFQLEGTTRRAAFKQGQWLNLWLLAITRPDWEAHQKITTNFVRNEEIRKVFINGVKEINSKIVLEEYNPHWPDDFQKLKTKIEEALPGLNINIEHVGSTSVPNLAAKPIIDIALEVPNSSEELSYVPHLEAIGFQLHIREPEWWEHRMFKHHDHAVHLHVFTQACPEVEKMTSFRDHLKSHPSDFELYLNKKRELAKRTWKYLQHYADAKTEVVKDIMSRIRTHQNLVSLSEVEVSTDSSLLNLDLTYSYITNSYWANGIPRDVFENSVKNSLCFGVYKNKVQIGFARVVSDYSTFAYLGDVFIVEEERGKGYSKILMDTIMNHPQLQGLRRFCLGTKDAHDLYKKYGFEMIKSPQNWMEIKRSHIYQLSIRSENATL